MMVIFQRYDNNRWVNQRLTNVVKVEYDEREARMLTVRFIDGRIEYHNPVRWLSVALNEWRRTDAAIQS